MPNGIVVYQGNIVLDTAFTKAGKEITPENFTALCDDTPDRLLIHAPTGAVRVAMGIPNLDADGKQVVDANGDPILLFDSPIPLNDMSAVHADFDGDKKGDLFATRLYDGNMQLWFVSSKLFSNLGLKEGQIYEDGGEKIQLYTGDTNTDGYDDIAIKPSNATRDIEMMIGGEDYIAPFDCAVVLLSDM
jgi:hypothetical protein